VKLITHFFFDIEFYFRMFVLVSIKILDCKLNYRWTFRKTEDDETIYGLAKTLKIPKSLAKVLSARGVNTYEEAQKFFNPSLDDLYDPYLLKDMEKVVGRILEAVDKGQLIWIHGDYDVDGTASTSMMLQFLTEIGAKVNYYIPDRFDEGYGLSRKSIDEGLKQGAGLLLTVDVGITSYDAIHYAKATGLDCIICDHHEPGEDIPEVYAIIDPIQPGCNYPFKHLAACGVAFKIVQAICQKLNMPEKPYPYLDFVALASAADMVPLIDENRTLVHYGLRQLNSSPRPGIKGLMECTNLKAGTITTSNIIYALAPLINAAGRMGDALRSVKMMTQKDEIAAFRIAQQLEQENRRRRVFDEQTFEEAIPMAKKEIRDFDRRSLVLHNPNWHAGIIGIVASRLVDKFNLPTVLLTSLEGMAKGSARSINSFDIHTALKTCSHFLVEFGGHKHAAGLSLMEEHIPAFRETFDKLARENITKEMLVPVIEIDAELKLNQLSPNFLDMLNKFSPYGFENNKPVFFSRNVTSANGAKIVGNNNLKFRAFQSNFVIDAIGYGLASKLKYITSGRSFSIVYNLEINTYNGQRSPQLCLKDIRPETDYRYGAGY
jgi:single-stranded-DNA-specific exonuclease